MRHYDGITVNWDRTYLIGKDGNEIDVPQQFLDKLPKEYQLKGELYVCDADYEDTVSIIESSDWDRVKFVIHNSTDLQHLSIYKRHNIYRDLGAEKIPIADLHFFAL